MNWWPLSVLQPVLYCPLHNRGHAFPVQPVLARRALPTQLPRQHGHGIGQRRGHSRPRLGPWKVFHPHSAAGTLHPARTVAQFQGQLPHREIAPLSLSPNIVNLQASLSANPAAQEPLSQPVDIHQHALGGLFHLGHAMSFQMQLFSDKGLYEHLGSGPFVFLGRKHEINPMPGCRSNPVRSQAQALKGLQLQLHFSEMNQESEVTIRETQLAADKR